MKVFISINFIFVNIYLTKKNIKTDSGNNSLFKF